MQRADLESRLSLIYSATDAARCKEAVFKGLRILGYRVAARPWLSALFQIAVCCRQQLHPPITGGDPREAQILGRMFQALPMVAFEKELSLQVWCMLMGVNVLERLPPSRHLGVLYGNLGAGAALAGAHKLALHFSRRAVESQRKLGDPFGIGQTLARRHRMDYELAWSLCERGRIGMAFGWEDAERDLGQGRSLLARIPARLPGERPAEEPTQGLSMVDRFTMLLETGRRIAGTLDVAEVRRLLVEAATALLRCQDCRVVDPGDPTISLSLMQEALRAGRTVLHDEGLPENPSESLVLSDIRSALCAPVVVDGRVECLLYVTHQRVGQLFGEEERRIGDYLASAAGGALENARNFEERQKATKRFETLFRWTGVGTAVVDERGQISEANPFFEKMLGLSSEASLFDAIFHADKAMVEDGWCMLFKGEEPLRLEVRCLRASGEMLWAQMTASRPPGQALAIAAFSDVSDRRLAQIATFQENERRLLAAELHDGVSQPLAALYFQLQRLVLDAKGARATKLQGLVQQAKGIVAEISQLMYDLRNPILGDVDALPAIAEYARGFAAEAGLQFEVEIEGGPVHGLVGTFLFRMVQEALANVRRHARASEFRLRLSAAGGEVVVTICDNGEDFDTKQVARRTTRHFGLDGMRERAELLGGRFLVNSALGQGTRVEFRLPTRQGGAL